LTRAREAVLEVVQSRFLDEEEEERREGRDGVMDGNGC
jgi:hypothetical protein